jgi:chitinase
MMRHPFRTVLLPFVLLASVSPSIAQAPHAEKVMGGYFEEWGIHYGGFTLADLERNGVAGKLTHLIYAFGDVTPTATPACAIEDPSAAYLDTSLPSVSGQPYTAAPYGNFGAILQLKALHPSLKVLISLGGQAGNAAGWVTAAATPAARTALASACIDLFVKGNIAPGVHAPGLFDGFNIDWEFPSAADKQNFTALLKEFRAQLDALSLTTGKRYVLTFDSPADPAKYANIDLLAAAQQVDFLTIDGYDLAAPGDKQTNEASFLYAPSPSSASAPSIDATVKAYRKAGVPAVKYTMGMPLYAVGWTGVPNWNHGLRQGAAKPAPVLLADGSGLCPKPDKAAPSPGCDTLLTPGFLTYATIEKLVGASGFTAWYDPAGVGATLYDPLKGTFYTYDNPVSVAVKTAYIKAKKLRGAYVWALNDDPTGSLTKAIAAGLQ